MYSKGGVVVEKWYSIQELADMLGISHTSISRYINHFPHFFEIKKTGKRKMVSASGVKVLRRVKELFEEGKTKEEVRAILEGDSPVVHVVDENEQLLTYLNRIEEQNVLLLKEIQEQRTFLQERDKKFIEILNNVLETRQEVASDVQQTKKRRWFNFFQNKK